MFARAPLALRLQRERSVRQLLASKAAIVVTKEVWSMSETPLPQIASAMLAADAPESTASTGEFRARKRSNTGDLRPVSAFSPGHRGSEPPAAPSASALSGSSLPPPRKLSEDELGFVS